MRRVLVPLLVVLGVTLSFVATVGFLYVQSRPAAEEVLVASPRRADIVRKSVATGAIVPRVEVELKSRVSGVVRALHVEPGDLVEAGQLIADIEVIPDSASLSQAQAAVASAKIELDDAAMELHRAESLASRQALSSAELQTAKTQQDLARQSYQAAMEFLQIVRDGATKSGGNVSTQVRSTVAGMVLAVDVEKGDSVTETNTFNAGTTIAWVADMNDMVFEGQVDESEVGRISEGMALDITVGALRERRIAGELEYISPKGVVADGAVQFEIRAAIRPEEGLFVRAGSSANADIVLERRDQVLAVDEAALRFEEGRVYVEVETSPGVFDQRDVKVGLSDGLVIEVLEGLQGDEKVKIPARQGGGGAPPGRGRGRG